MKLSVALCTFNGEKYLTEQLASIAAQSRQPDELVICDDQSTDATAEIVSIFHYLPIRFYRNLSRLGSTKNFEKAISLCTGDIIVLSDQDDIWYPWRLRDTEAALSDPGIGLVFGDGDILGGSDTLWRNNRFTGWQRCMVKRGRAYEALLNHNFITGATMAFRASLREYVLPISELWAHDGWIATIASLHSGVAMLPRPVIQYRQHSGQQVGVIDRSLSSQIELAKKTDYQKEIERFRALPPHPLRDLKIAHLEKRARMSPALALRELLNLRYFRFSAGFKSFAKDFLTVLHAS